MCSSFRSIRLALVLLPMLLPLREARAESDQTGLFVSYEMLEMSMNRFRNFAGQIGYRFDSKYQARLSIMEVDLTERHLSSDWEAVAVDGEDVEGYLRGYELHVDRFFKGNWYVSASAGYYEDRFEHTKLDESLHNRTFTLGSGIGYSRANLFGLEGLHLNLDIPVRYYFNRIEETKLGETTIRPHIVVNNIWLFLGYKF